MINVHFRLSKWERFDFPKPRQLHVFPADSAARWSNGKVCCLWWFFFRLWLRRSGPTSRHFIGNDQLRAEEPLYHSSPWKTHTSGKPPGFQWDTRRHSELPGCLIDSTRPNVWVLTTRGSNAGTRWISLIPPGGNESLAALQGRCNCQSAAEL